MPEELLASPVAPETPAAPPAEVTPDSSDLSNQFANFEKFLGDEKPKVEPTPDKPAPKAEKEEVAPKVEPKAKIEPAPTPDKAKDEKAKAEAELKWDTTPKPFREAHEAIKRKLEETTKETETRIKGYEDRLAKFDAIAREHDLTKKQLEQQKVVEQRLKAAEERLYAQDYGSSQDFKEKFADKWQSVYEQTLNRVKGLAVRVPPAEEGMEPTERQATQRDLEIVRGAPENEQWVVARKLFGDNAHLVTTAIADLERIARDGREAIAAKQKSYDADRQKYSVESENYQRETAKTYEESLAMLAEKYPTLYKAPEDKEELSKWEEGNSVVQKLMSNQGELTPQQRGQNAAMLSAIVTSFPVVRFRLTAALAKIEELEKKVSEFQGSDPGGGDPSAGGESASQAKAEDTGAISNQFNMPPSDVI